MTNRSQLARRRGAPILVTVLLVLVGAIYRPSASAAPGDITYFPVGPVAAPSDQEVTDIICGPDGNLWFAESLANLVGRLVPPGGAITEFPLPPKSSNLGPVGIATGPDGNFWITHQGAEGDQILRMTADGSITGVFPAGLPGNQAIGDITAGPDGNMWFVTSVENKVGRITPSGTVTLFEAAGLTAAITAGPDGNVWFSEIVGGPGTPARITPDGTITRFPAPSAGGLTGITTGPDGNIWYLLISDVPTIVRMTPAGVVLDEFTTPSGGNLSRITVGADGNLWVTDGSKVLRV
ncbi:MAG: hypothetical protein LC749_13900, partial [Actinobacteria bacterium]|nr:hypothetical protein [Actinomycetota bacterium]